MPYKNPYNLSYCLSGLPFIDTFNILEQKSICIDYFTVNAAIIGSSHFLKINNDLLEILTCQKISNENTNILKLQNIEDNKIHIQKKRTGFFYEFTLVSQKFSTNEFNQFIKKYQSENHWLQHAFHQENALTVIDYQISDKNTLHFITLHSYPETNTIIITTTSLCPDF